ncbi:MAG: hypothetical protein HW413_876 [Thermoleophilia bacterium]|nr:hypothetical protein [Thermoleophilia bacterium]
MSEIERALIQLGRQVAIPAAPDVVPAVLARLESRRTGRPRRRRWVLVAAAAALAALAATLAIPDARSALLRVLHIGGARIEFVEELPAVTPAPPELDLDLVLGRRVTLEQARRATSFDLRELDAAPDRVYLGSRGTVWFLYGTPQRVRLLVAQTPGLEVDEAFILKKLVAAGTRVENVSVVGERGFLITGSPHLVLLVDQHGTVVEESARLARSVLVWEANGIMYRLEGDFTSDEALALAEALR